MPLTEATAALSNYDFLDEGPSDLAAERTVRFFIEGVRCSKCVHKLESLPERFPRVRSVRVNLSQSTLEAVLEPGGSLAGLAKTIHSLGFKPYLIPDDTEAMKLQARENRLWLMRLGIAAAGAGNIMLLSISVYAGAEGLLKTIFDILSLALFLPVLAFSAFPFYVSAFRRWPSVDLPIVAALWVGAGLSVYNAFTGSGDVYFDSLSMLVFLLLGSRYFLRRLQQRFLALSYIQPFLTSGRVERWSSELGTFREVPVDALKVGDRVRLRRGQRAPGDGHLLSLDAFFNTAVLSGEPVPRRVLAAHPVFAGYQLESEAAELQLSSVGADSRLGQILRQAESQVLGKSPLLEYTDRVGRVFTWVVLSLSAGFFAFYATTDAAEGARRALTLIILSCPCALAFATPLAQSVALMKAAARGYFLKKAETLERLAGLRDVFFDKTGTLTLGEFRVLGWEGTPLGTEHTFILGALESHSLHPIAQAVTLYLKNQGLRCDEVKLENVLDFGRGVRGDFNGKSYKVMTAPQRPEGPADECTRIGFYQDQELLAVLRMGDRIRPDSRGVVAQLEAADIRCHMLTGDALGPAMAVAERVGIAKDRVHAALSPEGKHELLRGRAGVMMVGDGANDALAMASAPISLAVQGGMEASLKAADIYSARPGLEAVPELVDLSRETLNVMKRTLKVSLFYNLIGGSLALLGLIGPLGAAILMPLSSVSVVLSAFGGTRKLRAWGRAEPVTTSADESAAASSGLAEELA